eukprot:TRINITY_DN24142_c0_g1_i4.p1 TRINITY_DN24142_c0_g1~~TRINITY_DN24142_c0_g1_i4.p1  ORF type:complete len:446 (-),score=58.21 TRINITY_DN24142_c0_g1_i4:142-1479(-)
MAPMIRGIQGPGAFLPLPPLLVKSSTMATPATPSMAAALSSPLPQKLVASPTSPSVAPEEQPNFSWRRAAMAASLLIPGVASMSRTSRMKFLERSLNRRKAAPKRRIVAAASSKEEPNNDEDEGDDDESFSLVDMLIKRSRNSNEICICTRDWHRELFDETPEGFKKALAAGVDLVDVLANGTALPLLASAETSTAEPRYCVRVKPKPTLGLGLILNKSLVQHWSVLGPLQKTMGQLNVGSVELLTLDGDSFPFWVYDAVAAAYQRGLCTRIGVSARLPTEKQIVRVKEELERRGVLLSCVFLELSLLNRQALPLVDKLRALGLQVFARESLGRDELASGRYTAENPTGGEISVPRYTLAQLLPLRPLHEALVDVAKKVRRRCERPEIGTTEVALQWVLHKGASPLCDVTFDFNSRAVTNCKDWKLTDEEVKRLDEGADSLSKRR